MKTVRMPATFNQGLGMLLLSVCVGFLCAPLYAQVAGASLSGTVSDPSGAPLVGVRVSLENLATGVSRDTKTDESGVYTAPNLLPGSYEVTLLATGFKTEVRRGITLTVGEQLVL